MVGGWVVSSIPAVLATNRLQMGSGQWWIEVWLAPTAVAVSAAVSAVFVAVWLARRNEMLGAPASVRRRKMIDTMAKNYLRTRRLQDKIPRRDSDDEERIFFLECWCRRRVHRLKFRYQKRERKLLRMYYTSKADIQMEKLVADSAPEASVRDESQQILGEIAQHVYTRASERLERHRGRRTT